MIVCKFGGSSLANAEQFSKVKAIVENCQERRIIVPSAPGRRFAKDFKITDVLYLCHEHMAKSVDFEGVFSLISERYIGLRDDLKLNFDIEKHLEVVKAELIHGASRDYAASRGEYLNGLLLSAFLRAEFIDPYDLIVIKRNGKLDKNVTYQLIDERLKDIDKAVIPGFYGKTPRGEIKTFSRGGSDISGAVLAAGVSADVYENWTDVSGFMMADPSIVGESRQINEITYRELRELSYMGANVFHEEAVFPVLERGIPIHIKNTNMPNDNGTKIVTSRHIDVNIPVIGISGKPDFTVIGLEKTLLKKDKGLVLNVLSILEHHDVAFEHMPSGIDSLSLVISDEALGDKLDDILDDIDALNSFEEVNVSPNMALIAVVGQGMVRTKGVSGKVFGALSQASVNVRMINQGANELSILIGVENEDMRLAIRAIYEGMKNDN